MLKSTIQVWFHYNEIKNMWATLEESMPRHAEESISAKGRTYFVLI